MLHPELDNGDYRHCEKCDWHQSCCCRNQPPHQCTLTLRLSTCPTLMIGSTAFDAPEARPTVMPPPSPSRTPVILTTSLTGTGMAKVTGCLVKMTVRE